MLLLHESRYKRLAAATDCLSLSQSIAARVSQVESERLAMMDARQSRVPVCRKLVLSRASLYPTFLSLSSYDFSLSQSVAGERVCVCGEEDCGLMVAIRETSIQQDI